MGLSTLPAPSEGMLCIILVNTASSISTFKGIVRSILHIVGILLTSSSTPSATSHENPPESFDLRSCHSDSPLKQFRNRTPALRFSSLCSCMKQPDHDCSVCLTRFEPESEINKLSCGHLFHKICLEKWIDYWNITCPLCRACLIPEEEIFPCIW
ncbi:PREDICTED: probable E3 ubiquitin-protein ligase XERICO [Tarenaya hassleriana]|uniref:probable E3 ubiquitin-protein ligase XERICO n=1 Tax=Tarenaya hassleriana TaxID=28532 RepID=UPI00053C588A|nr:PREDICTED: probable E3 ubiquitin-protein ligase XERICO [Tarenaya hassleriana]